MAEYKRLVSRYLDENDIKFTDVKENVIKIAYSGDNLKTIPIFVFFDKDGDPLVTLRCWEICNFKYQEARGILTCNEMNSRYRWVTFYVDDDDDVIAQIDSYIDEENCGSVVLDLVRRMVNIIDETYPKFMKARWGAEKSN